MFALARDGKESEAHAQIRLSLQARQAALSTAVARLLVENNESEQDALDNVRSLSQALHPALLDEAGLEGTLDWYFQTVERQTGLVIAYEKSGPPFPVDGG